MGEMSGPLVVPEQLPDDLPDPIIVRELIVDRRRARTQAIWRFPNGYGASVVNGHASFGVELLVVRYFGEGVDDWEVADWDEEGWLTPGRLVDELRRVRDLARG